MIAAYNDMTTLRDPRDGDVLLIGLEAYIPRDSPPSPGLVVLDATHHLEGGGWYLIRHADGQYDLRQETEPLGDLTGKLVAPRTIVASPFAGDTNVYMGGYDANITAAHNTAWIVRAPIAVVLGEE